MAEYGNVKKWYGNIPVSWRSQRIKSLFKLRDERSYLPLEKVNLISLYSNIGVRQYADIEHTTGNKARNADGYKIVHQGDIIVNILLCWMGAIGRSDYDGVTSPAYDVYIPRNGINSRYYHYLFRTKAFSGECYKAGKGIMSMRWRTYSNQFMNISVPVPPHTEQDQIVRFLDWKVSEIDKKISTQEQSLELAKELLNSIFQSLILKCSRKVKLKRVVTLKNEYIKINPEKFYRKAGMYNKGRGIFLRNPIEGKEMGDSKFQKIHKKCLMISGQFAWEDAVFITTEKEESGVASHRYYLLESINSNVPVEYLFGYFISQKGIFDLQQCSHGAAGRNRPLNIKELLEVEIPIIENQPMIIEKFCDVVHAYMKLRPIILHEKEIFHELKNKIISDVVTGKLDVRNISVPEKW